MEGSTTESDSGDSSSESFSFEDIAAEVSQYVARNQRATNTRLFSFLALLNKYIPRSYLMMHECRQILGPPDPIYGGPPFEERMEPFTRLIFTTGLVGPDQLVHMNFAHEAVDLLANCKISRSTIMKNLMDFHSGYQDESHTMQVIKHLLTNREIKGTWKCKFSSLIEDMKNENIYNAVSVLEAASDTFPQFPNFPQTLSRLHYLNGETDYGKAEKWAKIAIKRAPYNSYVADTLGQVHKHRLLKSWNREAVLKVAEMAFRAFKDVEQKAMREEGQEMMDTPAASNSKSFNNRGHFGFIQVAKIVFEKLNRIRNPHLLTNLRIKQEVKDKFDFFEWYLTYSMPDRNSLEPPYFWKDVAVCYEYYTTNTAAKSTSFAGLLDKLRSWKGSYAELQSPEITQSDLEKIQEDLGRTYKGDSTDVEKAEKYILSNITLSNKIPNAPQLVSVRKLRTILLKFLMIDARHQSPEFYLLVMLLFWPENQQQDGEEEYVAQQTSDDNGSEPIELPIDLPQHVTLMKTAFDSKYDKFLRGRYLLPLFLLGKGCGLNKWVHKSRLDQILEESPLTKASEPRWVREEVIEMWSSGKVWKNSHIRAILLPVRVLQSQPLEEDKPDEVLVWIGGNQMIVTRDQPDAQVPKFVYLGFTIEGPVAFSADMFVE
ncbi:sterile alpha motif domain-containing protein 9-like [Genypterus blacodes]|uniref:sterile alpha motif domain-containing protein 9-like n=1 Tax=Genypterus blacodes TaxID=154954 RepID=UPI003F76EB82